jgi:hypothetical protein
MNNNEKIASEEAPVQVEVIVVVEGGVVQTAWSNDQNIKVGVLDHDNWKDAECGEGEAAHYANLQASLVLMGQVY